MTTKCPVEECEEICEIAATDGGADSEPALKQIPNLTNPNYEVSCGRIFRIRMANLAQKPTLPLLLLLPILPTDVFRLATEN